MRKVTERTTLAFLNGITLTIGNTSTDGQTLTLHGNTIAKKVDGEIYVSSAGWETVTTKERLNGLLHFLGKTPIHQKDFVWYRGDRKFSVGFEKA